jgi:hypothetical protein
MINTNGSIMFQKGSGSENNVVHYHFEKNGRGIIILKCRNFGALS